MQEDCDQAVLNDPELAGMIPGGEVYEVTTVGAYTHYVAVGTDVLPAGFTEDQVNLYNRFLEYTDDIIYGADYYEPQEPYADLSGKAAPASMAGTPYRVICVDEDGNPVQGATIQFCSDIQCMMGKTDADGVAEFDEVPGSYIVHLLKVPEGFAKDSTEYEAPAVPGDLTIVVKAA